MLFVQTKGRQTGPAIKGKSHIVFQTDRWDDFGVKCQFYAVYWSRKGIKSELGHIKILSIDSDRTVLPGEFSQLDANYIALGQSLDFYRELVDTLGLTVAKKVLESLNDISWQPYLAEKFELLSGYRNALLRENTAELAKQHARSILLGQEPKLDHAFTYGVTLPGASTRTTCKFNFSPDDPVPGRISCIIGRNATGKTRFLAALAKDLVHITKESRENEIQRDSRFSPARPLFNRIIAVSYSAFDRFARPESKQVSYIYSGIRSPKGNISKKHLEERFGENVKRVLDHGRFHHWRDYVDEVLHDEAAKFPSIDAGRNIKGNAINALSHLSSGQAILINFVTSILAWIDKGSLVLFDEPETHLHPNAVANLFSVFTEILREFDSYAIMATHSPIVVQEVPSKRVSWFVREDDQTIAKPIPIETFGESISEITRHVFETIEAPSFSSYHLERLLRKHGFEHVQKLFDGRLSMRAESLLLGKMKEGSE